MNAKDAIKQRRLELGLTMLEVAKAVGVSESTISRWESGDISNMRQDRIIALCEILHSDPIHLLGWPNISMLVSNIEESPLVSPPSDTEIVINVPLSVLSKKISRLDEIDREKVEAYTDGLLAAEKYQEPTHLIKMAARAGGGIREVALTESQIEALKNLPEVPNLDNKK